MSSAHLGLCIEKGFLPARIPPPSIEPVKPVGEHVFANTNMAAGLSV